MMVGVMFEVLMLVRFCVVNIMLVFFLCSVFSYLWSCVVKLGLLRMS